MSTEFRGTPGVYAGPALKSRNIFATYQANMVQALATFALLDGSLSRDIGESPTSLLRAGVMIGKITATGKYRPSIIGLTTAAAASNATTITVPAVVATEVARLITLAGGAVALKVIGPPAAAGTVATISVSISAAAGTTLTIAAAGTIGTAAAAGSAICPADGSQAPLTVLSDQYGVDVLDTSGTNIDQPIQRFLRGADLISSRVVNLLADEAGNAADTSVTAFFKAALKSAGPFTFDDDR